jgi:L-ascorbate metabolism protein UlaG (beta-lactamase superfamily)
MEYFKNEKLKTILKDWKGNPHTGKRFIDPHKKFGGSFSKVWRWKVVEGNAKAKEKKHEVWRLEVIKNKQFLETKEDCIVWLGHASFFIRINGIQLITDPVFYRISGVVPRYSSLPCEVKDFKNIDYVLLSHGHRDHCDQKSLQELAKHNNFELLTSLNLGKFVSKWLLKTNYQEAGWFQEYNLSANDLTITYLPAQHWSNRYPWDLNEMLWGSFMIQSKGKTIYFGGDSGYSNYPKQIAELFPSIDFAMIGVGAYTPDYMMQEVHTNPYEAVQVIHDLKSKNFIPMHYGTFDLADEPLGEPHRILSKLESENKINASLKLVAVGEMIKFE